MQWNELPTIPEIGLKKAKEEKIAGRKQNPGVRLFGEKAAG